MANRNGGFIGTDGLDAPDPPTGVSVSGGVDGVVSISFTAPTDTGTSAITGFVATASDGVGATGTSSPISISSLTLGSAVTFRVLAQNAYGYSAPSDATDSITPAAARGVFGGGGASGSNVMQYVAIGTTGNTTDFGNLTSAKYAQNAGSVASSTRGIFATSYTNPRAAIDYFTIATTGNASDFGDMGQSRHGWSSFSSSTRGVFTSENDNFDAGTNKMQYITIASTGDSSEFGDAHVDAGRRCGLASTTRGVTSGGYSGGFINSMEYLTIASTGNGSDFGNMTVTKQHRRSLSNNTRGVILGGNGAEVTIDYITIANTGNATDFGDLTVGRQEAGTVSNSTRGLLGGGAGTNEQGLNSIEYITIGTTGNTTDFGDLLDASLSSKISATCNSHGGL